MKKSFVIAFLAVVSMSVFAQKHSDVVVRYLSEFCDTSGLYRDVVISNVDDDSWPALGVMSEEISFHYTYEHVTEQVLVMVSKECNYSAITYTEYYIYDVFQKLRYYIYESGETYIVNAITSEGVEGVDKSSMDYLSDNYFIDSEYEFLADEIRKKSNFMLSYLDVLWGVPNYAKQKEYIVEKFKEINSMNNLVERKSGNVTAYYNDGKLVKMIQKGEIIKEFYIENEELFFVYFTASEAEPEYRAYFYRGKAFKFIYGKESLQKNDYDFFDHEMTVYDEYLKALGLRDPESY